MTVNEWLKEAERRQTETVARRRFLHSLAETGFGNGKTREFIESELQKAGLTPRRCGRSGVVAVLGKGGGKTFLLRADSDALPVRERSGLSFAAKNGNMHACGHDMHTAMLLCAAELLKTHEEELCGTVKLMFQPAEEILEGARDMIEGGVLEDPKPDFALMLHVIPQLSVGKVVVCPEGIGAPAADYFCITVQGKGCHGAMPNTGVDPISVGAHIVTALQQINARELSLNDRAALTVGSFRAGEAFNAIPDGAELNGTLRAFDEDTRRFIKKRLCEIAEGTARTFRAEAEVTFTSGCPTLVNDGALCRRVKTYLRELLGKGALIDGRDKAVSSSSGSEDFAYISHEVPSVMAAIGAAAEEGTRYPLHHPSVIFNERALPVGAAVYACAAYRRLQDGAASRGSAKNA